MPTEAREISRRVLDPYERASEVLFGLIMVLTFTGSLRVAEAGQNDIRTMLIGALGCNIAWGIIDGVLYLMGCLADRGRGLMAFHAVRGSKASEEAHGHISDALPPLIASALEPAELEVIRQRLMKLPDVPRHARLTSRDWAGAAGVFLLVFLSTFPVVIPFIVMTDAAMAMRISNGIAIGMLFLTGYAFGRMSVRSPIGMGIAMVFLGFALVAITMALGG
jgi:hypothetical protein